MTTIGSNIDLLTRLQNWYTEMCNDDWEHTYGIFISNIDNPGWSFKIELKDTYLYEVDFEKIHIQRKEDDDWVTCSVIEGDFVGFCGPNNLSDLISVFLTWAESNQNSKQIRE